MFGSHEQQSRRNPADQILRRLSRLECLDAGGQLLDSVASVLDGVVHPLFRSGGMRGWDDREPPALDRIKSRSRRYRDYCALYYSMCPSSGNTVVLRSRAREDHLHESSSAAISTVRRR